MDKGKKKRSGKNSKGTERTTPEKPRERGGGSGSEGEEENRAVSGAKDEEVDGGNGKCAKKEPLHSSGRGTGGKEKPGEEVEKATRQGSGKAAEGDGKSCPENTKAMKEKKEDIPLLHFFKRTSKTYIYLILWVLPSYLGARYLLHYWYKLAKSGRMPEIGSWHLFEILQVVTAKLAYYVSRLFGIPVEYGYDAARYSPTLTYTYPSLGRLARTLVYPDCTAFLEIIFITALMMGFNLNMKIKDRLKWAAVLSGIIYIENIGRLVMNGPIMNAFGWEGWERFHWIWWKYAQLGVVILIFVIWFLTVGKKYSSLSLNGGKDKNYKENRKNNGDSAYVK